MQSKLLKLNKDIQELEVKKAEMLMETEGVDKELKELAVAVTVANEKVQNLELEHENKSVGLMKDIQSKQDILEALNENVQVFKTEIRSLTDEISDLNKERGNLDREISVLIDKKRSFEKENNEVLEELQIVKKESFELTIKRSEEVVSLDKNIKDKKAELDSLLFNIQKEKAQIAQDHERLDSRERDLSIYDGRLKEKYPNETIIIS